MKARHISECNDLTAYALAGKPLLSDDYHQRIARAAGLLCTEGMGNYRYATQYSSGTTEWFDAMLEKGASVTSEGVITLACGHTTKEHRA